MKLFSYFRSSASYRVRIALQLKGLDAEQIPIHLLRDDGEQLGSLFAQINPARLVPVLEDSGEVLTQSLAIMEYLDERHSEPPLLPRSSPADRAYVRQLALAIACEIHPLNNLRVLRYLTGPLSLTEEQKNDWYRHWVMLGFAALEQQLAQSRRRGIFCFGDAPGLADCCLIPQIANAARVNTNMTPYPTLRQIEAECLKLEAFQRAHPSRQPDAET